MKQLLLALVLLAVPVGLFAGGYLYLNRQGPEQNSNAQGPVLGDLSALKAIVTDVKAIADKGDLVAAEKRITDFETAWDDAQPTMQPKNAEAWGFVDGAADAALKALRQSAPVADDVTKTLTGLLAALDNPAGNGTASAGTVMVKGIAVTDASGHPLPCEAMLKNLTSALATAKLPADKAAAVADLQAKALERCNADDDTRADAFSAEALSLISP